MSLIRGNALAVPLADESVDLIVTSPPYFALRSYIDACGTCGGRAGTAGSAQTGGTERSTLAGKGPQHYQTETTPADPDCPDCNGTGRGHYDGQIGSEATPADFIAALVEVTRECVRVLKPSGSLWVNLGDKYASGGRNTYDTDAKNGGRGGARPDDGARAKSLLGLPWRYALACIDDLGLILRAEVIWSKPNGLPESVQDRVRRSHENWFHFTKEPRYFSAVDEIREPTDDIGRKAKTVAAGPLVGNHGSSGHDGNGMRMTEVYNNPLGKLPGSVWTIPTEPLRVPDHLPQHFAAFPSEWPKRIILGWSPSGICVECGQGRRPVVEREPSGWEQRKANGEPMRHGLNGAAAAKAGGWSGVTGEITGESCACPTPDAPTRPAIILDPFAGTGTTVAVANALGRHGVGLDLSADYLRLARWRCQDPGLRAKVLGVDKPKPEVVGQLSLGVA